MLPLARIYIFFSFFQSGPMPNQNKNTKLMRSPRHSHLAKKIKRECSFAHYITLIFFLFRVSLSFSESLLATALLWLLFGFSCLLLSGLLSTLWLCLLFTHSENELQSANQLPSDTLNQVEAGQNEVS
jgi:hypothetical protein